MTEEKRSLVDKASTQNVVAGLIIIGAMVASIIYGKWELLSFLAGGAVGYLFPKTQK